MIVKVDMLNTEFVGGTRYLLKSDV